MTEQLKINFNLKVYKQNYSLVGKFDESMVVNTTYLGQGSMPPEHACKA